MKSKALLAVLALTHLTCHQVLFTAPPGSEMQCIPNPTAIAAFNGVSTISCLVTEATGFPVADGTVVQFFTDLGRIPEQGRTNDGVVRVNLTADGRSGTASVVAVSGGNVTGGGTTPTSATSSTTTLLGGPGRNLSASDGASGSGASSGSAAMANGTARVVIGTTSAASIRISAFPPRLTDSRTAQLTATVFDENGNPVAGVPVFFEVVSGSPIGSPTPVPAGTPTPIPGNEPIYEHLDSQGQPRFTDSNGQAFDVLRTRYPREAATRAIVVKATIPFGDRSASTTVFVN